jgi:hypothetical protein
MLAIYASRIAKVNPRISINAVDRGAILVSRSSGAVALQDCRGAIGWRIRRLVVKSITAMRARNPSSAGKS